MRARRRNETGSALLLVPTGVLIVLVLAAITVDAAAGFMAERTAASIASAAANDLATLALDADHFRSTGEYRLSADVEGAVERVRDAAVVQAGHVFDAGTLDVQVRVLDPTRVEVRVSGRVTRLILPSLGERAHDVSARAVGTVDVLP